MACPSLLTAPPTSKPTPSLSVRAAASSPSPAAAISSSSSSSSSSRATGRREVTAIALSSAAALLVLPVAPPPALAESDEEYVKETEEVINKMRTTINMDKMDPDVAAAVAELREASNTWVAKYRRQKALLGRPSFRDMYSALNAVSGHYISFGPTAPIPAKRKTRILEELDSAEKSLLRGR